VKQCQTLPPGGVKGFAPNSALMIRMRNLSMTMMTRWPMRMLTARQFQKADAITLKDYLLDPTTWSYSISIRCTMRLG